MKNQTKIKRKVNDMAWKNVSSEALDIKKEKDVEHIGTYTGSKAIVTKIGDQTIWQFTDEDGKPFGIYGFSNLNRAMEAVAVGQTVKIVYLGTKFVKTKFKPSGQDVHQVQVQVYEDGSLERTGAIELQQYMDEAAKKG